MVATSQQALWPGVLAHYGDRLNISHAVEPVTLHEGNTPLIKAERLADEIAPGCNLYFKYEGLNPSGSFKDRGMTAAVTQAKADGASAIICASTGNTAASAAAYAARGGMKCVVLIPEGKIAMGKLAGAIAYGAQVVQVRGSFDDALDMVREISSRLPITLVNSVNPARLEGQKTAAWEVEEQLGRVPDFLCLPVGNAGNITAYWMGFRSSGWDGFHLAKDEVLERSGPSSRESRPAPIPSGSDGRLQEGSEDHPALAELPIFIGGQAEGSAPIVLGHRVHNPETIATAIRIGNPARWQEALQALKESNGLILAVSDQEILECYELLARMEGIFCEPSSAAGVASLRQAVRKGKIDGEGKDIVCVLTGHGLKDPDNAIKMPHEMRTVDACAEALMEILS